MDAKHSSGPWLFYASTPTDGFEYYSVVRNFGNRGQEVIADVHGPHSVAQKANASLIAAAPDIYEALREARERVHLGGNSSIRRACIEKIDAAIAKADGRAPAETEAG